MANNRGSAKAVTGWLIGMVFLGGCATHQSPTMQAGNGAISGKLIGSDKDPFNLSLAGEQPRVLAITLSSPAQGQIALTHPRNGKPEFVFENVMPGEYELNVYTLVPGKRSIAGSQPVTVNADQVTPVTITLQVTSLEHAGAE